MYCAAPLSACKGHLRSFCDDDGDDDDDRWTDEFAMANTVLCRRAVKMCQRGPELPGSVLKTR